MSSSQRGSRALSAGPHWLVTLGCLLLLFGCGSGPSPAGEFRGSWIEADRSTVEVKLSLMPDGRALMQRTVRWPDGRTEADSWESQYRFDSERILIGSEGKTYAVFLRQGGALLDPAHLVGGKPIRLERQADDRSRRKSGSKETGRVRDCERQLAAEE